MPDSTKPLRLGIAGLGTVGAGVVRILQRHREVIAARAGRPVEIIAVSARTRDKDRGVRLNAYAWEDDPVSLSRRDDIDVFVELMGGADGPAKAASVATLEAKKDLVTANKAMLAIHGQRLAETAEANGSTLKFEAAVAGGIPAVKALREGLAGNEITRIMGVMNGTCNYMLTRMESAGLAYEDVFDECQRLGYLEADPTLDVGGIDAAHKLTLLAATAFGTKPEFGAVHVEGIEAISIEDIEQAAELGYRIKLLGVAQSTGRGLETRMSPCLVPRNSSLGSLEGPTNMVVYEGDAIGSVSLSGPGAGEGPTASAVMSDIIDIARGYRGSTFGKPASELVAATPARASTAAPFYLRLMLPDRPGTLAKVAAALGESGVSINRMRQRDHEAGTAPVLIVTHPTMRDALDAALAAMQSNGVLAETPVAIRIESV